MNSNFAEPFAEIDCYTQMHNSLLDAVMPVVSGNAWKILCLIVRQTRGWQREECGISYKEISEHTRIKSRATISSALDELIEMGLVEVYAPHAEYEKYIYALNRNAKVAWVPVNLRSSKNEPQEALCSSKNELACSSKNELINKKEEKEKKEGKKAPAPEREDIGSALEELYPGHSTNFRVMRELYELTHRVNGSTEHVKGFPAWLKEAYPKKANSPFAFKDLFPEYVKTRSTPSSSPAPKYVTAPQWYLEAWQKGQNAK